MNFESTPPSFVPEAWNFISIPLSRCIFSQILAALASPNHQDFLRDARSADYKHYTGGGGGGGERRAFESCIMSRNK